MKKNILLAAITALVSVMLMACLMTSCGKAPTIEISDDGYWVIDGEKTDVLAKGEKGDKGDQGIQGEPGNASSVADENPQGLAFYLKDDGSYAVEIGYAKYLSKIEIPSTYNGKPVTEVGKFIDATTGNIILKEIIIPDSVTSIGNYAFGGCSSLTSIVIPDSVTSIGEHAFSSCISLTSIEIPDSVTSIGDYAFDGCSSLTSIEIPDSMTSIGKYAFSSCLSLTSVEIPDSVTSIGEYAFRGCNSLTSVEIGNNVTSIGNGVFSSCIGLTSVEIPDSVTRIDEYAFSDCDGLTSIVIPDSVTSIRYNAFNRCYKLAEVINKSSLNITEGSADYGYAAYYAIEVHSGESKIVKQNDYLFYTYNGVNYLLGYVGSDTELVLPASYNGANYEIYQYAFYENDRITSVVIPDSVRRIGECAFSSCYGLTIYCEAASKPGGWDSRWNYTGCPVVWGYKG